MTLVVPNSGEIKILELTLNKSSPEDLSLHLYSNDYSPDESSNTANFTEVMGSGYSANNLVSSNWNIVPGDPTVATYSLVPFTFNASFGNVYGYFIKQTVSNTVIWAERFSNGPYNIQNNGDQINVTPRIQA